MPAYDSILRDHIDANEANARRVIARAEDPRSAGWMLSCQWLIPSASPFLFFSFRDLISIPTQSFRILSSFLPNLPLLPFLLCQPIPSGSSGNDANYRKEADVTAKHPCDEEESSCVIFPPLFLSLSWKFHSFQPHFFFSWHPHTACIFPIPVFVRSRFLGPPTIASGSHVVGCQLCDLPVFCICPYGNFKHSSCRPPYGDR